jgi:uncharacterized protein
VDKSLYITVSRDRLKAVININPNIVEKSNYQVDDILNLLKEKKICFGIKNEVIESLSAQPLTSNFPQIVAEGIPSQNGQDAYLVCELTNSKSTLKSDEFNFRDVIKIPSVKSGQLLASTIPAVIGTPGKDVFGNTIHARDGKPLNMKVGNNVVMKDGCFYSVIDGQQSQTNTRISVNPVFELNGDIDLRIGNIDFIGNVVINGNVPSGYKVKAGGDMRITGLVEGAVLEAAGNIVINGGVAGANRGKVVAGGNVFAAYFNQADITAEKSVWAEKSILNSCITAGESIICKKGAVIGGSLTAGRDIHIKDLGNHSYTKTSVNVGHDSGNHEDEQEYHFKHNHATEMIKKLNDIEQKLVQRAREKGMFTEEEKQLILKQRTTKKQLQKDIVNCECKLYELERERTEKLTSCIYIYETVYPNTSINFGKYTKRIQTQHQFVKFYFENGEIEFEPLN